MARSGLVDVILCAMAAKVVHAAAELRIADLLAQGVQTTEELAERTGTHAPSLRRLLRALAGLGVLTQTGPERFELAQLGQQLRADVPGSVRELVRMRLGSDTWLSWDELVASVRTGDTGWDRVHGMTLYQVHERRPEQAATFNAAMSQQSRAVAPAILAASDFSRFGAVVDVGGGDGTFLAELLRAHPGMHGVLVDLPAGLDGAAGTLTAAGVADRCQVVPGDFFTSVPGGGDAYVMKQILHNWEDEQAIAILRNCRKAMAPTARLLVLERVLPDLVSRDDRQVEPLLLDIQMLVVTGGRERTEPEFRGLFEAAGFTLTALTEPLPPHGYRVIEGTPA
jgi:DNA-binding CsgD family transcriptional regulator